MKYQQRYEKHQARKKKQLTNSASMNKAGSFRSVVRVGDMLNILRHRRSQRVFITPPSVSGLNDRAMELLFHSANIAPSSCDRHGIRIRVVRDRREKELLSGLLVGGVGWIHRAEVIFLFLADKRAYVSPNEKEFMHYCDVGFTAMSMWLTAESMGLGACYVNPNLVDADVFYSKFGSIESPDNIGIFCGALAIGSYDVRPDASDYPFDKELEC